MYTYFCAINGMFKVCPYKKEVNRAKYGEQEGYSIPPLCLIHLFGFVLITPKNHIQKLIILCKSAQFVQMQFYGLDHLY